MTQGGRWELRGAQQHTEPVADDGLLARLFLEWSAHLGQMGSIDMRCCRQVRVGCNGHLDGRCGGGNGLPGSSSDGSVWGLHVARPNRTPSAHTRVTILLGGSPVAQASDQAGPRLSPLLPL